MVNWTYEMSQEEIEYIGESEESRHYRKMSLLVDEVIEVSRIEDIEASNDCVLIVDDQVCLKDGQVLALMNAWHVGKEKAYGLVGFIPEHSEKRLGQFGQRIEHGEAEILLYSMMLHRQHICEADDLMHLSYKLYPTTGLHQVIDEKYHVIRIDIKEKLRLGKQMQLLRKEYLGLEKDEFLLTPADERYI